jgi:predicted transcriptional regulator of viral defense system
MHDTKPDIRGLEAESYQQSGYFTVGQARRHGVSRQLLNHHLRQGRFERVRRGLYHVTGFPGSQYDDIREKWMAAGMDKAVLSHESALALLELSDNIPDKVHLLVPRRCRGLRRPPGVVIHTRPDDEKISTVWHDGMPVTAPARTLVDVAEELQPDRQRWRSSMH